MTTEEVITVDWDDHNQLNLIAYNNVILANHYKDSRSKYAEAKTNLDILLAQAYLTGEVECKMAYDKAILFLIGKTGDAETYYRNMLKYEADYKGLERVIEANRDKLILAESLIKNVPKQ